MTESRLRWELRRAPLKKVGRRGAEARRAMDEARVCLLERSGGVCEGNDFSPHCTGVGTDAHHIWPSDRDRNRHEPERMAYLCRFCHMELHANPNLANKAGLLKRDGED